MGLRQDFDRMDLSFNGWVMSHFKPPWERFQAMHPNTPSQPQHVIDERAAKVFYHDIDMAIAFGLFGAHSYFHGAYAATNTIHFYRLAQNMRIAYELVTHRTVVPAVIGNYLYDKGDGIRRSDMVDSTGYTASERAVAGLFPAIGLSISNFLR